MDNLRAAILRPQLQGLDAQVERWNVRYRILQDGLRGVPGLRLRETPNAETHVGSSIQFMLPDFTEQQVSNLMQTTLSKGVELKWFGADEPHGYTSRHQSWRYAGEQHAPRTDVILKRLFDMRVPLTFSEDDCAQIAALIVESIAETSGKS
jgi:dTDP-4-amino-4,6-dideoxygalactose transaminase